MIKEVIDFTLCLNQEFKQRAYSLSKGLHIFLESDENLQFTIKEYFYFDEKIELTAIQKKALFYERYSSYITMNKQKKFDPKQKIHSSSPFSIAFNFSLGNDKKQIEAELKQKISSKQIDDDLVMASKKYKIEEVRKSIDIYFKNAKNLCFPEIPESVLLALNNFNHFLTSTFFETLPYLTIPKNGVGSITTTEIKPINVLDRLKEKDYVRVYLTDIEDSIWKEAYEFYYNGEYPINKMNQSDFLTTYNEDKPFLTHKTASFDYNLKIKGIDAQILKEFQQMLSSKILPNPLPIFIHQDEIKSKNGEDLLSSSIALFKKNTRKENRISYEEIIEELYKNHTSELGNYYLLYYDRNKVKDFDFVPKFEYILKDSNNEYWKIQDWFGANNEQSLKSVFQLHQAVLQPIFNNSLVTKTKTAEFQYKYFDDIDPKYCKSAVTYLLVMKYRRAFYDFIYKSKRQAVTSHMFNQILQTSIIEDIRLDEIKNGYHTQDRSIKEKMNIWFSLTENFNANHKNNSTTMASKLQIHREFMQKLTKGEAHIASDDEYAFTAGQVIYYLLSKSKTTDRSYKRLEPFMQQIHAKELNKAIARMFDSYKHENFSSNFKIPFAEVLEYDTKTSIRDLLPIILSGVFSNNALFTDKEQKDVVTNEENLDTED